MQGPAVFMDLPLEDQAQELRAYLKGLGAEISEEKSPKGIEDDLHKIIGVCDACFREGHEQEVEEVLNDIVSIMVLIPLERAENLILAFCEKLSKAPGHSLGLVSLKALWLLFQSLDERSPMRYHVYYHLVHAAKQTDQVRAVFRDVDHLKAQFAACPPSAEQMHRLYRLLHEVLSGSGANTNSGQAAKVMLELLGTYTAENASHAREDAIRCIIAALDDPDTFLLDPLLALKPVRFLEGELIHDLLSVFVSENLASYMRFYRDHREFVQGLGLCHERNVRKMRLLTFMQLAEASADMSFETVRRELQLADARDVEPFVVEVLGTRLVRARMDQAAQRVHVTSTMRRTFERAHWQQLADLMRSWRGSLQAVHDGMKTVAAAQLELATAPHP